MRNRAFLGEFHTFFHFYMKRISYGQGLKCSVCGIDFFLYNNLFRDGELAGYVTHILEALTTIEVPVDPAMKKSLEQQ